MQKGGHIHWQEEIALAVLVHVQFVMGLPCDQYNQLIEEETKTTDDQHLEADIFAQVGIQFGTPVKVKDWVAAQFVLARIG